MEAAVEQTTTPDGGPPPPHHHHDHDHDAPPTMITNNNIIAKGKRTKRQRPQSPNPFLFTFSSTNNINIINNHLTSSPVSSNSGFPTTTEDEDTAESLILLSKGQSLDQTSRKNKDDHHYVDGMFKFNSKKYIQSSVTGSVGIYVYECKTCSRTFPSFQALGGHRASHKKPKNNEDIRKPYTVVTDDNEHPHAPFPFRNHDYSSFSLQFNKLSSKLHECSICGTEFNSGQALGGHMRRHRVAGGANKGGNGNGINNNNVNNNTNAATTLSLSPFGPMMTVATEDRKSRNIDDGALCLGLGLDLNLPAPREAMAAGAPDDQRQKRNLGMSPTGENEKKQQPAVHLSAAPTLVDCHY